LLSITRLISNIESLNNNSTPDRVLNSFEFDNSLLDNFSPEFEAFCDHIEETRSGSTTTHANDSLLEYDSFCFEIEPDQERLINVMKNYIPDDSSNDPLLEEADLFLASNNSIPPGIEDFADDSEGDIHFLEELLIDDSILSHDSSNFNFEDNPSIPRPPPEPPDAEFDAGVLELLIDDSILSHDSSNFNFEDNPSIPRPPSESPDAEFDAGKEIPVVMNDKDEDVDYSSFIFVIYPEMFPLLLSAESEDTIFDPGISD
nr:hypothetical protein [Tanacetum cinerariifolium]